MEIRCNIDKLFNRSIEYTYKDGTKVESKIKSNFFNENYDIHQNSNSIQIDLHNISTFIYAIDKAVPREVSIDGWTRQLKVNMPVSNFGQWLKVKNLLEKCLSYLSGDNWEINFYRNQVSKIDSTIELKGEYDAICMLSGGLDSYIGAIDLLHQKSKVLFLSFYSQGKATKPPQKYIKNMLIETYKVEGNTFIDFTLNTDVNLESSTRTRSFLFFTHAVLLQSLTKGVKEIIVPENGFIALNIPITHSRIGSGSTRTTHPYYFEMLNQLFKQLSLDVFISNPYRFKTKGEMMNECKNYKLLKSTYNKTVSCSNPSRVTGGGSTVHCGHCLPCVIRKAAISTFDSVDQTSYAHINFEESDSAKNMLNALKFFQSSINQSNLVFKIQENGPIKDEKDSYIETFKNGYEELFKIINIT